MNERIQKLAEQAGYLPDGFGIGHWDMPECQKFAELLVREFLEVVKQSDNECNDEWDYAERDLCGIIKQHFGVEE